VWLGGAALAYRNGAKRNEDRHVLLVRRDTPHKYHDRLVLTALPAAEGVGIIKNTD